MFAYVYIPMSISKGNRLFNPSLGSDIGLPSHQHAFGVIVQIYAWLNGWHYWAFFAMLFVCLHAWKCQHLRRRLVEKLCYCSLASVTIWLVQGCRNAQRFVATNAPASQQRSAAPTRSCHPEKRKPCQSSKSVGRPWQLLHNHDIMTITVFYANIHGNYTVILINAVCHVIFT